MLETLKNVIDWTGLVIVVHLIDIEIVVGQDLSLVDVLLLVDVSTIKIECELLTEAALDLLHLSIIPEREVIHSVAEV